MIAPPKTCRWQIGREELVSRVGSFFLYILLRLYTLKYVKFCVASFAFTSFLSLLHLHPLCQQNTFVSDVKRRKNIRICPALLSRPQWSLFSLPPMPLTHTSLLTQVSQNHSEQLTFCCCKKLLTKHCVKLLNIVLPGSKLLLLENCPKNYAKKYPALTPTYHKNCIMSC